MFPRVRRAFALLDRRARACLVLAATVNLVIALMEAAGLGLLFPLLQGLVAPDQAASANLGALGKLTALLPSNPATLGGAILGLFLFKNACALALLHWQFGFLNRAEAALCNRLTSVYLRAPLALHLARNPAELIRNVNGTGSVVGGFLLPVLALLGEMGVVVAALAVTILLQPLVTLSLISGLAIAALAFQRLVNRRLDRIGRDLLAVGYHFLKTLNEGLASVRETIVLGRQEHFVRAIAAQRDRNASIRQEQMFLQAMPRYYLETILLLGLGGVAVTLNASQSTAEAAATIGLLGAVGLRLLPSVNRMMVNAQQMRASAATVDMVCDEFAQVPTLPAATPGQHGELPAGPLRLEGVSFTYPGRDQPSLNGIGLTIPVSASVGIVGASGAGKSTLVDVILGLLHPQAGTITVGGRDIQDALPQWRRQLGYVPQTIYLADDTLRRNIAFGREDHEIDEARIAQVVTQARLDDVIAGLPDGLETRVGDRGARLSGGQRQRIGIARALYHDPGVLVFDEATSALDNETEGEITRMIETLSGHKTLLIVAHRLSTIRHCDTVVMMERGAVKAMGRFDELAKDEKAFANLVKLSSLEKGSA